MIKYIFFIFVFVSCSTSMKSTRPSYSKDTNVCNLNISFRSHGSGIDRHSYKSFIQLIEQFESEENVKLSYEQIFWGREGEMDYCFHYSNLTEKQISKFEKQIRELFIESKTVYFSKETEKRKGR